MTASELDTTHPFRGQDLTGQKFNRITVLRWAGIRNRGHWWHCLCDCGTEKILFGTSLKRNHTRSCGCFEREQVIARGNSDGLSETPEGYAWKAARRRCTVPANKDFKNYGDRGITMCPEWMDSCQAFVDHIGPRPSPKHTVDRIDNNRGYEPGNVRWATKKEQGQNRRTTIRLTIRGVEHTILTALGLPGVTVDAETIRQRLRMGWDDESAVFEPRRAYPR